MAKRSQVPQFGVWTDNVQYTAYFENARRDKGKMINPNDPEQNPAAFNHEQRSPERPRKPTNQTVNPNANSNAVRQSPQHRMQERTFPEVSRDRSSSEHSNDRFNHRGRNGRPSSETYPSPSQPRQAIKSADSQYPGAHHRVASVPKFGAWDESNPQSGDGFTLIFDNVKNQKQHAATNFQTAPEEPMNYQKRNRNKHKTSSTKSNVWKCFFP